MLATSPKQRASRKRNWSICQLRGIIGQIRALPLASTKCVMGRRVILMWLDVILKEEYGARTTQEQRDMIDKKYNKRVETFAKESLPRA